MGRSLRIFALLVLLAGGWLFFQHYEIEGLDRITVRRRTDGGGPFSDQSPAPPARRQGDTIRIASFNVQVFGDEKAGKPHVMKVLAEVIRRFDIVAIQEIRSTNPHLLPLLVEQVNDGGRYHYDYIVSERLGRTHSREQYAFVLDTATVQADPLACYTVSDPNDLLHRPPLVCAFQVRGVPVDQAFTFSLINVHTDPDEVIQELEALADVYREVRLASGGEDDIILVGDLNADDRQLGSLGSISGIRPLISGTPTNTRGTQHYDHLLIHETSTSEFTGKAGVFDLRQEFRLTAEQALEISDHFPVWAEFSVYEQGLRAPIAARPDARHAAPQ